MPLDRDLLRQWMRIKKGTDASARGGFQNLAKPVRGGYHPGTIPSSAHRSDRQARFGTSGWLA
ncbi:MAG: hypothetical protein AVDCRST_MAG87-631 [uncultured Thermomicrobiales bacterium]|uniref:Uncharacterized protein n=1 Tax=uncultured Thermomicrobiales bacterium TaxID=1645740 RepID=A0A6J4UGH5_9BACT|nr:MAG: hypothetical protein AVDCRST_MAG87-631 [uncultured Thermomicrobiales bacterium]